MCLHHNVQARIVVFSTIAALQFDDLSGSDYRREFAVRFLKGLFALGAFIQRR